MGYVLADRSGTVSQGGGHFNCFGRVYIVDQNARNNSTRFKVELWHGTNNTNYRWEGSCYNMFCRVDGAYRYPGAYNKSCNPWTDNPTNVFSEEYEVTHDANGYRHLDIWLYALMNAGGYGPGHCYVADSGTAWQVDLPQIDRSGPGCSLSISAVTTNTITLNVTSPVGVDYMQYKINDGGWIDGGDAVIRNLAPNTTYRIRARLRKTSNWVWSESGEVTVTTHPNPVTVTNLTAIATNPFNVAVTVSTSSPSTTDHIAVTCNNQTINVPGGSGTAIFDVLPDTTYSVQAVAYTVRSGAVSAQVTTTVTTPADAFCRIVKPDGTVTDKKKMYLIDTTGVKTEIKKDNIQIL